MTLDECIKEQWRKLVARAKEDGYATDQDTIICLLEDDDHEAKEFRAKESYAVGYLQGMADFEDATLTELLDNVDGLEED